MNKQKGKGKNQKGQQQNYGYGQQYDYSGYGQNSNRYGQQQGKGNMRYNQGYQGFQSNFMQQYPQPMTNWMQPQQHYYQSQYPQQQNYGFQSMNYQGKGKGYQNNNPWMQQNQGYRQNQWKGQNNWKSQQMNQSYNQQQGKGKGKNMKGKGKGMKGQQNKGGKNQQGANNQKKAAKTKTKKEKEEDIFMPHPNARRSSLLTTLPLHEADHILAEYNARAEKFTSNDSVIGALEIVFLEPTDKEIKKMGLIVAFHGMEPTKGTLKEWSEIPRLAKWQEMGMVVALPNVEMHSAIHKTDIQKYVQFAMRSQKVTSCILVGKAWGGNVCIQYALDHPKHVKGLILLAPSGPPRRETHKLKMPTLVCWAEGDPVIPLSESEGFLSEMKDRVAPTTFKLSEQKTHNFSEIMEKDSDIADVMKHFVASVLIMSRVSEIEVVKALCKELPESMQSDDPHVLRKLAKEQLPVWCKTGMLTSQE